MRSADARLHASSRFKSVRQSFFEGQYFGGASLFKDARARGFGSAPEVFAASPTLLACIPEANFPQLLMVDPNLSELQHELYKFDA